MNDAEIKKLLDARISRERAKELLIDLVKVPSPQTELLEDEPLLKAFIKTAIEPRLRAMGFADIRYDAMGNLIATYGAGTSGKSLMFIGNAMNQPASTMPNPYSGDVVDGAKFDLPGKCVMGKGASEQKANLAAMLHAMETVIASKVALAGRLIFTCCLSGETGKHDAIKSVVEGAGVRADMAVLGGTGLRVTLGNRGRIDVFVTVKGAPCHSSRPWDGINAITGATETIRALLAQVKVDKSHPQLGKQSLTVNHIRSFPESTHTVQDRCEFTLDRRLLPGDDPSVAFAEIEGIAKKVEQRKDPVSGKSYSVDVRLGPFMYPSLVTTECRIVRAILHASEVMLGKSVETYYSPSAFDQGYLNHVGIATANFGAGEHQYAHTDFDMASVERTTDSARVYAFDTRLSGVGRGVVPRAAFRPTSCPVSARNILHIILLVSMAPADRAGCARGSCKETACALPPLKGSADPAASPRRGAPAVVFLHGIGGAARGGRRRSRRSRPRASTGCARRRAMARPAVDTMDFEALAVIPRRRSSGSA